LEVSVKCNVSNIWVAAGTYRPSAHPVGCSSCSGPRDNTFLLPDGVALYGGFAGNENPATFDLANRDFTAHETILSGDIDQDGTLSGNAYHVVVSANATTRLDGFTVTVGNADGSGSISFNGQTISRIHGGGTYTRGGTNTLTNNTVAGNSATNFGGGIFADGGTNTLTNNTVAGNTANRGGGIFANSGTNTLTNNTVAGNTADSDGGGIYTEFGTYTLTNNTVTGNTADLDGGGIYTFFGTNTLTNNIIWGNNSGISDSSVTLTINDNIIQGGFSGTNNLDIDPLFVNPLPPGLNTGGDYRLLPCSPAINAGSNLDYNNATGVNPGSDTDLDGNARLVGAHIDLGAYEFQSTTGYGNHIYVDVDATAGNNNGTSWNDAFTDLQDALEVSVKCNVSNIWVAEGTYRPSAYPANCGNCLSDRDNTFLLPDGVAVYGGFAGTEDPATFDLANRDFTANETILSGDIGTLGDDSDNVHHVVLSANATTRLDGFTVTGGKAEFNTFINVNGQSINRWHGAGISTYSGDNTVTNNNVTGNQAMSRAGGIYTFEGTNTLNNNTVTGNTASSRGGGIYTIGGTNTLTNNTVAGNQAEFGGGGIYTFLGTSTLTNNTVAGNSANFGGGIYTFLGTNTLTNNTVTGNTADSDGGGIYNDTSTNTLTNNIIWGNNSGLSNSSSNLTVNDNIIQGGFSGNNNLDTDPLFVNPLPPGLNTGGDYSLQPGSPAINAGNNAAYANIPGNDINSDTDLAGNPRLFQSNIDMGAFEADFKQSQWRGILSDDWANSANWDEDVPDDQSVAVIRDISLNTPQIMSLTTGEASRLLIGENAALNVEGVLKPSEHIDNDGLITFKSHATATGQLDEFNGTVSGTGEVTVERFIPAKRAFRLLSSPVTTTDFIFENWQESGSTPVTPDGLGTHITGGLASLGFDQSGTNNPSMFTFDVATQNWDPLDNTNATKLTAGEAYLTMVRGDRTIDLTVNSLIENETTLSATGELFIGSKAPALSTQTGFYNLIANPYQAVVDYSLTSRTDLTDFIYVWDASITGDNGRGGYVTVDVSGNTTPPNPFSSDASKFIPPGLSFFVQNVASGTITPAISFNEDDKATEASQVTVFSSYPHFYINSRLYLSSDLQSGNSERDAIGLRFSDDFTTLGSDEDATKLSNPDENYAIVNNGLRSIDNQGLPNLGDEIELSISNYTASDYSLTFVMENKPEDLGVFLVDNYLNTQTELTNTFLYDFTVDQNIPESIAENRFKLKVDNTTLGTNENAFGSDFSLYPNPTTGQFTIKTSGLTGNNVELKIYNILGQQVFSQAQTIENNGEVNVDASGLSSGLYMIELQQDEQVFSTKLIIE
jgi:parallel beta-helix repeat protein